MSEQSPLDHSAFRAKLSRPMDSGAGATLDVDSAKIAHIETIEQQSQDGQIIPSNKSAELLEKLMEQGLNAAELSDLPKNDFLIGGVKAYVSYNGEGDIRLRIEGGLDIYLDRNEDRENALKNLRIVAEAAKSSPFNNDYLTQENPYMVYGTGLEDALMKAQKARKDSGMKIGKSTIEIA